MDDEYLSKFFVSYDESTVEERCEDEGGETSENGGGAGLQCTNILPAYLYSPVHAYNIITLIRVRVRECTLYYYNMIPIHCLRSGYRRMIIIIVGHKIS